MSINPEELDLVDPFVQLKRKKNSQREKRRSKGSEAFRLLTYNLRYRIVLNLARLLTPSFYRQIMIPKVTPFCRPMIAYVRNNFSGGLIGAEVGVYDGDNAKSILDSLSLKKLYLVDPYIPYLQDGVMVYPERTKVLAQKKLKDYTNVIWLFKDSVRATAHIEEGLDFAYIDACHSYSAVKRDIEAYYSLVHAGGVLGGHDFTIQFVSVVRAVSEFALEHGLNLFVEQPDWWVIKNE